eukprot:8554689-Karenia_brevis.AAC.1
MGKKDFNSQNLVNTSVEFDAAGCVRSATASHASPVSKDCSAKDATGSVRSATASHASPVPGLDILTSAGFDRAALTRLWEQFGSHT